jgi:hypothetical protein
MSSGMARIPRPRDGVPTASAGLVPGGKMGQAATGLPGQTAASAMTRRTGRAGPASCRPWQAGLASASVATFQPNGLAPPQPGVADRDDHGEILVPAGYQRGPLCQ